MEQISELKSAGNKAYSVADYKTAISNYSQALAIYFQLADIPSDELTNRNSSPTIPSFSSISSLLFSPLFPLNTSSSKKTSVESLNTNIDKIKDKVKPHVLYSNRSASFLHLGQFENALADALACIKVDPLWPKAYYRKGEALIAMERYDEALPSLYRALEKFGEDDAASKQLINQRIQYTAFLMQDKNRDFKVIQMLAGREFAVSSWSPLSTMIFNFARQMQNHVYALCCEKTKKCALVDVCWDVDGIVKYVQDKGYSIVAAIVTHYHFDHVGGLPPPPYDQYRVRVDGLEKLLQKFPFIKAYIHAADVSQVLSANPSINVGRIEPTHDDYFLKIGDCINVKFIHTPGHTPGSQCLLVNEDRLLSGDTLFISNVGRLDFPDSNTEKMFESMKKLKKMSSDVMVYPGHDYGGSFTTLDREMRENSILSAENFNSFFVAVNGG